MSKYILREVCKNVTDGEHGTVPCEVGSPYYLLSAKNLLNGKIILTDNERTISKQSFDKIRKRTSLEKDDVLISTVGTIGNLAIADEVSHYEFNRDVGIFKCNKEKLIPEYLYYYLSTDVQQKRMMKIAKGVTQKHLYISDLEEIDIDIPNVQEQSKAIYQLKKIDEKIGLNKKVISILESMAKTLYDYWFVQFDFPDANGHPYKTSGGKMEWNETLSREIPAGWEVGRLADYCSLQRGVTYGKGDSTNIPQDGYEPILRANNIQNHELNFDSLVYLPKKLINEKQYLKNGEILIAMSSGSMEHIGKVARVFYDLNYGFGAFCSKITPLKDTGKQYVYYYVISDEFQLYIHNMCLGTNIRNLTNDHILNSKLCKIPEKILSQFESKMAPIHKKQALLKQENINLSYIRDFLLPMLMNGQVTFRQ